MCLILAVVAVGGCDSLGIGGFGGADDAGEVAVEPTMTSAEADALDALVGTIPPADLPEMDLETALTLVAMPLSCLDRPHAAPRDRSTYLDEIVAARRPGYERNRAFYGCWDWHSAVNSTWAMVKIYKLFPELPVAGLVREKLNDHLSAQAMEGELEFFQDNQRFERPYGWAWLLELYAELRTWEHPGAEAWADNVEPLAALFSERMVAYLPRLERPSRSGAHSNTAFSLALMLEYARTLEDAPLEEAIVEAAYRLYINDVDCPTGYEPWGSDFLSPCLEEAALMGAVLEPEEFIPWFDGFMPPVTARAFAPLTTPVYAPMVEPAEGTAAEGEVAEQPAQPTGAQPEEGARPATEGAQAAEGAEAEAATGDSEDEPSAAEAQRLADEEIRELASRSHLIGLAFIRADAMIRIADALPAGDPRIEAYRRLAAHHGAIGFEAMFDADYAGSHWIGTFALKYLLGEHGLVVAASTGPTAGGQ